MKQKNLTFHLGHVVAMLRQQAGLKQTELATLAGVGTSTVRRLESDGTGNITNHRKICSALGRRVGGLMACVEGLNETAALHEIATREDKRKRA